MKVFILSQKINKCNASSNDCVNVNSANILSMPMVSLSTGLGGNLVNIIYRTLMKHNNVVIWSHISAMNFRILSMDSS